MARLVSSPAYPTISPEARRELEVAAKELLGAAWSRFKHATQLFQANPTAENWRALVYARAGWQVALRVEEAKSTGVDGP